VQHTDVSQGPLQRRYGLATLTVHTAGTENAQVQLPGLPHDVALSIRDHLLPGNTADAV
jgi:membrane protein YdbS with pleckstrin-like domain